MDVSERVLPMEGALPPDLQGTLFRVGPALAGTRADSSGGGGGGGGDRDGAGAVDAGLDASGGAGRLGGDDLAGEDLPGALHAIELRDGAAVSYLSRVSQADAGVFWHAGSVLALPETGLPLRYTRFLDQQEFGGSLTVPIASHARRVAADGGRVLFTVDDGRLGGGGAEGNVGAEEHDIRLIVGEWDAAGVFLNAQAVGLERATWQHDIGVTEGHVVFIESPTTRLGAASSSSASVPFGWLPGAEGWVGVLERGGHSDDVRWFRFDPALVTHVLGAWEEHVQPGGPVEIVLYVCRYDVPEPGEPVDLSASVVGPQGIGLTPIGGSLAVLERWRITGDRLERTLVDERGVEYPRMDATCDGMPFRYGYAVETAWSSGVAAAAGLGLATSIGLLKFDLRRDEVAGWTPGPGCTPSEPVFVRAGDGRSDEEGWLLTVVDDANRGASDLYVLDASSLGRHRPEAIIHLPERLPFRSHGEWVPADRYR